MCRLRVAGRGLLGHGKWCRSHVDFGDPCLVPLGPPCGVCVAGVCGGAGGRSGGCCGAAVGFLIHKGCTYGADIGVDVRGAADGSCGPGVVVFVLVWEEAVEELDAMAPAVSVCVPSAAKRASSVGGSMVGIAVRSIQGLIVRRWRSAVGDICRRCLRPGSVGLLSSQAWKVSRHAAQGGVQLWCWALADLLVPRGACGVRGVCCPVAPTGLRWSSLSDQGWANERSGLLCKSHRAAIPVGRLCGLCEWLVGVTSLGGTWAVGDRWRWCPVALSGQGGPRGSGVRIVQMLCRIRASRKRRAALWCHRQCNRFRSSGV